MNLSLIQQRRIRAVDNESFAWIYEQHGSYHRYVASAVDDIDFETRPSSQGISHTYCVLSFHSYMSCTCNVCMMLGVNGGPGSIHHDTKRERERGRQKTSMNGVVDAVHQMKG